ncbi:MAG TPA: helix-turn-helix transcriptional regulator [Fimbriimonadaceae bacterium]|nr:helix-turn-helix transcriptional regulator [Fimbriimonadaceae bacterium]HRJ97758.1 helix-turn-helix transcriptional regulator [Fimbriimonadaceae bacterium]
MTVTADASLGTALKSARKSRGHSIARTSMLGGVSTATVKRWENGQGLPPRADLLVFLDRLGVPSDSPYRQVLEASVRRPEVREGAGRPLLRYLRSERRRHGLTLESISEATGVSVPSLHRYESGLRAPDSATLRSISLACGCGEKATDRLLEAMRHESAPSGCDLPVNDLFSRPDQDSRLEVFARLDRMTSFRTAEASMDSVLDLVDGFTILGDPHGLLEAWPLVKPLVRLENWSSIGKLRLGTNLLLARVNVDSSDLPASEFARYRRSLFDGDWCSARVHATLLFTRVTITAGAPEEAANMLTDLEREIAPRKVPHSDMVCELYRRAVECDLTGSRDSLMLTQLGALGFGPLWSYNVDVATVGVLDRLGDRAEQASAIERCRAQERRYGFGSPLVNRIARRMSRERAT